MKIQIKKARLVNDGELIKLTKGLYKTNKGIPGYYVANAIYGRSYLSFASLFLIGE